MAEELAKKVADVSLTEEKKAATIEMPGDVEVEGEAASKFRTFDDDRVIGKKCPSFDKITFVTDETRARPTAGKPTILLLWAQYHKPGYKFLPLYSELSEKYAGKAVVVGLSTDPDDTYPTKFIKDPAGKYSSKFNTSFTIAHDAGNAVKTGLSDLLVETIGVPHMFLIDADGNVVWHQRHGQIGATAPTYMKLVDAQVARLVLGKPLQSVGNKPVVEDSDDGEDVEIEGDDFDLF